MNGKIAKGPRLLARITKIILFIILVVVIGYQVFLYVLLRGLPRPRMVT